MKYIADSYFKVLDWLNANTGVITTILTLVGLFIAWRTFVVSRNMENDKSQLNELKKMVLKQTKNEIHVKQMNLIKLRSDSRYLIQLGSHTGLRGYENNREGQIEYVSKIKQASALIMTNPVLIDDDTLYNHWSAVSRDCDIALAVLLGTPGDEQTRLTIDKLRWDEFSSYFGKVVDANIYANQYSQRTLEALKPEIKKLDSLISSLDR